MAEYFTKLDDLNKNRIDWKIQVCCCRKWQVPVHENFSESLELLLVDKFGIRIQTSVKGYIIDRFMDLIVEGGLYLIEQFSVADRPKNFPVAIHPYKISFHKNTYAGPTVSTRFPKTLFNFRSYSDIKSGSSKDDAPLFGIIGTIVDFNDSRMKEDVTVKGNRNIHLLLEDLKKTKLQCVLWDPYCHQVQNVTEKLKNTSGGYSVVIIQLCRAKMMRVKLVISNTFYAIKVVVDQQVGEIVEYISKLPDNDSVKTYIGSQLSNSSVLSVKEELQSASCIFMTLEELKSSIVTAKESAAGNSESGTTSKDVYRLEQPYEVDNLIGRELLFKVGIDIRHLENKDNVYVVERVCEDAVLIKEHKLTDHKVLDFVSRPYKDIVQENDWDPEPSDFYE
ncbi:hypothetical protein OROMI_006041 [Orobanche minor]